MIRVVHENLVQDLQYLSIDNWREIAMDGDQWQGFTNESSMDYNAKMNKN